MGKPVVASVESSIVNSQCIVKDTCCMHFWMRILYTLIFPCIYTIETKFN